MGSIESFYRGFLLWLHLPLTVEITILQYNPKKDNSNPKQIP